MIEMGLRLGLKPDHHQKNISQNRQTLAKRIIKELAL